ncbi:MAG: imidazole glycerol phosphate synthase subunit HisH [Nitrososphaerota archaeon]|nr:imidazole glycerol phosphate synthase subunit HisH [Nitrososphaerota archaeon]
MDIGVIDYGASNLFGVAEALRREGASVSTIKGRFLPSRFDLLVLPGVGSFPYAVDGLQDVKESIIEFRSNGGIIFGICLGLHLFFVSSEEGNGKGLAFLDGKVRRITGSVKVPHMGWSNTKLSQPTELWDGMHEEEWFYYAHSYFADPPTDTVKARVDYGINMAAVVVEKNVIGVQFHPEKSATAGKKLLRNLLMMVRR